MSAPKGGARDKRRRSSTAYLRIASERGDFHELSMSARFLYAWLPILREGEAGWVPADERWLRRQLSWGRGRGPFDAARELLEAGLLEVEAPDENKGLTTRPCQKKSLVCHGRVISRFRVRFPNPPSSSQKMTSQARAPDGGRARAEPKNSPRADLSHEARNARQRDALRGLGVDSFRDALERGRGDFDPERALLDVEG